MYSTIARQKKNQGKNNRLARLGRQYLQHHTARQHKARTNTSNENLVNKLVIESKRQTPTIEYVTPEHKKNINIRKNLETATIYQFHFKPQGKPIRQGKRGQKPNSILQSQYSGSMTYSHPATEASKESDEIND